MSWSSDSEITQPEVWQGDTASLILRQADASPMSWLSGGMLVLDASGKVEEANECILQWLAKTFSQIIHNQVLTLLDERNPSLSSSVGALLDRSSFFQKAEISTRLDGVEERFGIELTRVGAGMVLRLESLLPSSLDEVGWLDGSGSIEMRRELGLRLWRAEARLENLVNRWPGVIFSQRADFALTSVSSRITELTGLTPETWKGSSGRFWEVVHEADAEDLQQQYRRLTPAQPRLNCTYRIRHAQTGRISYVFESRQAVFTHSGLLLGYESVWLDTTRQTIAEKRLSSAAWKETLALLTMGLAHDFSNIMAGILSLSETFQAQVAREHPFQEGLTLIKRNSMQASQLVHRILNLHQGRVGDRNYHSLNDLVTDTFELVRKIVPRRIEICTELTNEALALYVDAVEFRQVLINLTLNAADAMPHGGSLVFRTSFESEYPAMEFRQGVLPQLPAVCLTVEDTGCGISSKHLAVVFDPFFTTKPLNKGSGLGLYNARLFVEKHGGAISVESRVSAGTRFRLWLPQADFTETERQPVGWKRHTILLAGSAGRALDVSASFLREHGYYVVVCPIGERPEEVLGSPDYQFAGVLVVETGQEGRASVDLLAAAARDYPRLKRAVQVVGRNMDEVERELLAQAELVWIPDMPEHEWLEKFRRSLDEVTY